MNKIDLDKSLEHLDPIKMLLFFLAFVAISLFIIFVFIVPSVKDFKSIKIEHKRQELSTARMKEILETKEDKLKTIIDENTHSLYALGNKFDERDFLAYVKQFFKNATLSKNSNTIYESDYDIYELNVITSLKSPKNFYDFLDGLKDYKSIIKADFPIVLKEEDSLIKATFNIKVYKYK